MKILVADTEFDNLLLDCTRFWCGVTQDLATGEVLRYRDAAEMVRDLNKADRVIGHNFRMFDKPALEKISGIPLTVTVIDTILISRLVYPDKKNNPVKGHSLEDWGKFLGIHKGDYSDFSQFTPEMLEYCEQDVKVTHAVYKYLHPHAMKCPQAVKLEHEVASIISQQIQNGFTLHQNNLERLRRTLMLDRVGLMAELEHIPPFVDQKTMKKRWWVDAEGNRYATKKDAGKTPVVQGDLIVKEVLTPFNHQSGDHIARLFTEKYGWHPKEFTDTGKAKTDRDVLKTLRFPEAKILTELSGIDKVLGTYADAWVRHERNGRIHGDVITNGTVTGRMSHQRPNINVPKVVTRKNADGKKELVYGADGKYGADCRSCFRSRDGWVLVGADASGLELRMLAHYMARWDNGAYAQVLLQGDIHSENQKAAGLPNRDMAKTFIYGWLYGAGDEKIGSIVGGGRAQGKELKERFLNGLPALGSLIAWVKGQVQTKQHLVGLDGRILPIRSDHSALNTLLQSAGAVVMKKALTIYYQSMVDAHGPHGGKWGLCANVHDEYQTECEPDIVESVKTLAVEAIQKAGESFNLAIRLDGEAKSGITWCDTH